MGPHAHNRNGAGNQPPCPVCCRSQTIVIIQLPYGYRLWSCRDCRHRFVETETLRGADAKLYDGSYQGFRSDPIFAKAIRRELTSNFPSRIAPPARILDVGCGRGDFLAAAAESGYEAVGLDVSEAAIRICRTRQLQAFQVTLAEFRSSAPFDFVAMWDVIEHVQQPRDLVTAAAAHLRPGGYLVIKTPAVSQATFAATCYMPKLAGTLLQVPGHIQFFSRHSLLVLIQSAGFSPPVWLSNRPMRGRQTGGSLKKRAARLFSATVSALGGDGNFYVMARK
jgi:2-polyprenyl-3-methyl-5-hydroxy-6-metoxy-1,4-benzoquinol methylase